MVRGIRTAKNVRTNIIYNIIIHVRDEVPRETTPENNSPVKLTIGTVWRNISITIFHLANRNTEQQYLRTAKVNVSPGISFSVSLISENGRSIADFYCSSCCVRTEPAWHENSIVIHTNWHSLLCVSIMHAHETSQKAELFPMKMRGKWNDTQSFVNTVRKRNWTRWMYVTEQQSTRDQLFSCALVSVSLARCSVVVVVWLPRLRVARYSFALPPEVGDAWWMCSGESLKYVNIAETRLTRWFTTSTGTQAERSIASYSLPSSM